MGLIIDRNVEYLGARYAAGLSAGSVEIDFATIQTGKENVTIPQDQFSQAEIRHLLGDLDSMARQRANEEIAAIVAEAFPAIMAAVRWAKVKAAAEYKGARGIGQQLAVSWLRPVHIGGVTTPITNNSTSGASMGLYGGTGAAVYSWLPTTQWAAGTAKTWYPSQTMTENSAIVHLGFLETEAIPKVSAYRFTISGQNTPVLPLRFSAQRRQSEKDPLVAKLVEPVIFGPKQLCVGDLYPEKSGESQPEDLAIVVTLAQNLTA